jgi:hypothetical protein
MLFDLTPEIILDKENQKKYFYARITFYLVVLILTFILIMIIIFPTKYFDFSFINPNSSANTIKNTRNIDGTFPNNGNIEADKKLYFNASSVGKYSKAQLTFTLNKKSASLDEGSINMEKSFKAFLYPEEAPIGFKDGTLLKNYGKYYIVSNEELREFKDASLLSSLGFSESAFRDVSADNFKYNSFGNIITGTDNYPDASLFKINSDYYVLSAGKLKKFISEKAYLSQYLAEQAIAKDESFFQQYSIDENMMGYADGSLIAYGESAFVVSKNTVLPINNVQTFEAMGYDWNDLITVGGDEISFYKKADLMTIDSAHPDGTIFLVSQQNTKDNSWYIIENNKKHFLPSAEIAASWLKKKPIAVSAESLQQFSQCSLKKDWIALGGSYSCDVSVENLAALLGKDYEFATSFDNNIKINEIHIKFIKNKTLSNFREFLSNIFYSVKYSYAGKI